MGPPLTSACWLPPAGVRSAAAFAIGEFSLYLQPEIVEAYEQVLPAVFYVMHDPTPEVRHRPGADWRLYAVGCSAARWCACDDGPTGAYPLADLHS